MSALAWKLRAGGIPLGAVLAAGGAGCCLVVGLLHLDTLPVTLCLFKAVTGRPCLTCGTTRVLGRLFAADLRGAVLMNPLSALILLSFVPWALLDLVLLARGRTFALEVSPGLARVLRISVPLLLVANWAYLVAAGR